MNTIEQLIKETEKRCKDYTEQCHEYAEIIHALVNKFENDKRKLKIKYYPGSYNGRKICFGTIYDEDRNLKNMILALMASNKIDEFLHYLTTIALPLFHNYAQVDDFHF